jgi:type VI secretion system protein ImpA
VRVNGRWDGDGLLQPISDAEPCGKNLESTDTLAVFDAYELFGQSTLDIERDQQGREIPRKNRPPDWAEIRERALDALKTSKDLRLLVYLGSALLRTDGIEAFSDTLATASAWVERYWGEVYPLIDEDAFIRQSALNCFADPVAVVEGLRRAPLVSSRQHGRFSLRDIDIAAAQLKSDAESQSEKQIQAAFAATPFDELTALSESVTRAIGSLASLDAIMRREGGGDVAPNFEPLSSALKKVDLVLRSRMSSHPDAKTNEDPDRTATTDGERGAAGARAVIAVGAIKSREDAIRALDAAAEFFRRNEPSSPIPLFLDRAKRLVAKDFLEVLADIAPDALPQARSAGGLKDE